MTSIRSRWTASSLFVVAVAAATVLGLSGCSAVTPASTKAPSATASVDPDGLIGGAIDPIGSTWSGTDSAGDMSVFALERDHRVKVTYGSRSFAQQGDTWSVRGGNLSLHVYVDAKNGYLDYTSTWNAADSTLTATGTTTLTSRVVTVTLTRK